MFVRAQTLGWMFLVRQATSYSFDDPSLIAPAIAIAIASLRWVDMAPGQPSLIQTRSSADLICSEVARPEPVIDLAVVRVAMLTQAIRLIAAKLSSAPTLLAIPVEPDT